MDLRVDAALLIYGDAAYLMGMHGRNGLISIGKIQHVRTARYIVMGEPQDRKA